MTSDGPGPVERRAKQMRAGRKWSLFTLAMLCGLFALDQHTMYMQRFLGEAITPPPQRLVAAIEHFEKKPFVCPSYIEADAYYWLQYAKESAAHGGARLRWTDADNTPNGRAVWWNSGLIWFTEAVAFAESSVFRKPLEESIYAVAPFVNLILLFGLMLVGGVVVTREWGTLAGCIFVLFLPMLPRIAWDFSYSRFDHHGQHIVAMIGTAVSLAAGSRNAEASRRWFIAAGVFTGVGLSIGATQQIVIAFLFVVGGAWDCLLVRFRGHGAERPPLPWKVWGISAAVTSLILFLVENAPDRLLQMRWEVNHPVYALLLLSAGFGLSTLAEMPRSWRFSGRKLAVIGICCAVPVIYIASILIAGPAVHSLRDPFMRRAHDVIIEFQSFWEIYGKQPVWEFLKQIGVVFVVAPILTVLTLNGRAPSAVSRSASVLLPLVIALPTLTFLQMRWSGLASAACLVGLLILLDRSAWSGAPVRKMGRVFLASGLIISAATLALWGRELVARRSSFEGFQYSPRGAGFSLTRDVALNLRLLSTQAPVRVLADPDAAPFLTGIARVASVGSYYWENVEGLRDTATAFASENDENARQLVRDRGITHVLVREDAQFPRHMVWIAKHSTDSEMIAKSFGARLIAQRDVPGWLEPLTYYGTFRPGAVRWLLYQVRTAPQP